MRKLIKASIAAKQHKSLIIATTTKEPDGDFDNVNVDVKARERQLRKEYPRKRDKGDDDITIQAAKEVAKIYSVDYKEILKYMEPAQDKWSSKSWDKDGNVITVN